MSHKSCRRKTPLRLKNTYTHRQTNTHTHTHTHTYTNTYTLSVPDKKCPRDSSPRGVPAVQFHNHRFYVYDSSYMHIT